MGSFTCFAKPSYLTTHVSRGDLGRCGRCGITMPQPPRRIAAATSRPACSQHCCLAIVVDLSRLT